MTGPDEQSHKTFAEWIAEWEQRLGRELGCLVTITVNGHRSAPRAEPYDMSQPFDAERLMGGFTVLERQVPVDPDSTLGKAMASAREAWAAPGYVPIDPETFTVTPIAVDVDAEADDNG